MADDKRSDRVIQHDGPMEWTLDCECKQCGWPWHMRGISETRTVDIHQTVKCPNCGAAYTMDVHHE